jgi:two-component system NarL family sensor kinase
VAAAGIVLLVPVAALTDAPVGGGVLAFYETLFGAAALAAGLFVGRLRAAESTGRLRARELSRRVLDAERQVRRRVAEDLHDGPVQDLVSLDLTLDAAHRALGRGDEGRAAEILREARESTERSIVALREEIVSLGPYALDELSLDIAIEQCTPTWAKRFSLEIELELDRLELSSELCGALFGVAQEAVANAGRHADAHTVVVSLHPDGGDAVELRVADDGHGFEVEPFAADEPGHIGLATMRERAELAGGALSIETGERGTTVIARVPRALDGDGRR